MRTHRPGPQKAIPEKTKAAGSSSAPYDVEFSEQAFKVYQNLQQRMQDAEKRGESCSSHHTVFRMVEDAIKNFIPRHPIDKNYGLTGPLSKFFRIKKGRHRICWAASSEHRKVCILFISETMRKAGDANDPYKVFQKLVESGHFDHLLGHFGTEMSTIRSGPPPGVGIN
jgi:mRNA-degrading endonuclease RelE of RelBE toxin-antitoxin system